MAQWWVSYSDPHYVSADGTQIDCTLVFPYKGGTITAPYTADENDVEPNGRELYAAIKAAGNIAPYIPPMPKLPKAGAGPRTIG